MAHEPRCCTHVVWSILGARGVSHGAGAHVNTFAGTTFDAFLADVRKRMRMLPHERYGQALFNTLEETRPELAEALRATALDPFYVSDSDHRALLRVHAWLAEVWESRA